MKRPHLFASRLRRWAGLAGLGLLLLPAARAHALAVTNGSFETGDLTGWTPWPDADKVSVVDDAAAHDGAKVCKVDFSNFNKLIQDIGSPAAVLTPGQTYKFTAWYRYTTDNAQDAPAIIWHYMDDAGNLVGNYNVLNSGPGSKATWTRMENDITAMDEPTLRLILEAGSEMGANGTAWFDDVRIEAPPAGFSNPLINPSFETGDYSGWTPWPDKSKISVVSDAAAPDGANVVKIDYTSGTGNNQLDQDIYTPANRLIPGKTYTMTAWYHYTSDTPGDSPSLVWLYFESDGVTATGWHSVAGNPDNTSAWTKIQNDIVAEDKPQFRVILNAGASMGGTGTAWFDDVVISDPSVPVEMSSFSLN